MAVKPKDFENVLRQEVCCGLSEKKLLSKDIEAAVITKIRNLFTVCDEARFAFLKFDADKMQDDYKELEDVIKYLERRRL